MQLSRHSGRKARGKRPAYRGSAGLVNTYRGSILPTGMTASSDLAAGLYSSLGTAFGGTVYDTTDLIIGSSRYNAATTLTVSTTGSTGRDDLIAHLATVAANDLDYKIIVPVATLSGGMYILPAKTNPNRHCWIVNTTIDSGSFAYSRGTKVPASTTGMTILEGGNGASSDAIVQFADSGSARGYSFHGCVIQNNQSSALNDIALGIIECRRTTAVSSMSDYPGRLYVDRCWLRASTITDCRRGILMNGPYLAVEDSRITEVHKVGDETSGIGGWTGSKYHKHINLTIEAGTQTILYGGNDPDQPNTNTLDPSDHYSERVYGFKPLTWLTTHPSYAGTHWTVKTGFEAKNCRRWLIDRCWSQNCWPDAQTGFFMLFQNLSDNNTNHLENRIEDIIIRNHRADYVVNGLNFLSRVVYNGGTLPTHPMERVIYDNVLMTRVGGNRADDPAIILNGLSQSKGYALQLQGDIQGCIVDRVTSDGERGFNLSADTGAIGTITNLVIRLGQYGAFRDGGAVGDAALSALFSSSLTVDGNVGFDLTEATMTSGWDSDETNSTMNFMDYANYDYRLTTDHLTKGVGGSRPGCDIATLTTLLNGINT
jgi:hypothetical protein